MSPTKPLMSLAFVAALAVITAPIAHAGAGGDTAGSPPAAEEDAGEVAFNTHCRTCHSVKPDDNRLGPTLHGIYGAPAGQVKDFGNYSGQLTAELTWDDATLDKFIANPSAIASSTTMKPFAGIQDAEQRKLIIGFLKTKK